MVTGGASGIGRATAEAMAREGAFVVVADRDTGTAAAVAAGIRTEGGGAESVPVDIADESSVIAMVEQLVVDRGAVDVLVNSAAITDRAHQARDTTVVDMDLSVWNRDPGRRPDRDHAGVQARAAADGRPGERVDRERLVELRARWRSGAERVRGRQGGRQQPDPLDRHRLRQERHPLQHGVAGGDSGTDVRRQRPACR